ncbi:hypothetical protein BDW62DRAFT_96263 [Aspergillus aurantiobrunneus]
MPAKLWHSVVLLTLFRVTSARADDGWADFSNNFATDLAPLLALFGERLTKQFLAESTSPLDNLLFALCPLGILTAVVSVIRVCGNPSLRAFVGRANEGPGEAENELLSCVSEGTAELFNEGGISRVFGRPRILEVVVWEDGGTRKLGTLRDALEARAWSSDDKGDQSEKGLLSRPEIDIPNLSLNKGIKRRGRGWFYLAALIGITLQGGTLVYAGMTVFWYSRIFGDGEDSADDYALPLYFYGSTSLSLGMFLCAFLIERSSWESYLCSTKPSKIYWLQPGRQTIGDQDFGAFLAADEGPNSSPKDELTYVKSVRGPPPRGKRPLLIFTICVTMLGFVLQFVGLRGLHPSVIIANVASTLTMAVIRTLLRTKRIGSDGNRFRKEDRELFAHNQQELDCFAYQLQKVQSFSLVPNLVRQTTRSRSGSRSSGNSSQVSNKPSGPGARLIQTRAQLAELTSCYRHMSMNWDDLPIRKMAHDLAGTIETTMEVVSRWKEIPGSTCSFELSFACQTSHKSRGCSWGAYPIALQRSDDTLQWKVDIKALEAILGLWIYSLLKSNPELLNNSLGRAVGLTKAEASAEAADLYFHKWIFRQREAKMVGSRTIPFSERTFGYYSDSHQNSKDILVVKSESKMEAMAAQEIYIQFLVSILAGVKSVGGGVDVLPVSQNSFLAQSTSVDELVNCFEAGNLGSREDALLCIVSVLNYRGLLPELAGDTSSVRERIHKLTADGNWDEAFSILKWLCERCEGSEFERSVYELGFLCQRAMLSRNANIEAKGFKLAKFLLQGDPRICFFRDLRNPRPSDWMNSDVQKTWWTNFSSQLGWPTWHIANRLGQKAITSFLESMGHSSKLVLQRNSASVDHTKSDIAQLTVLTSLDPELDAGLPGDYGHGNSLYMTESLGWLDSNERAALRHWFLARWAELGQQFPEQVMKLYVYAAQSDSDSAVQTLRRLGADINALGEEGCTALMELVVIGDIKATKKLLMHGADVNACSEMNKLTSLSFATIQGHEEILLLLLDHGADRELRNVVGFTPLQYACSENQLACATILLEKGANIESITVDGRTPIMSAAFDGYIDIVRLLIEKGANVNATDLSGATVLKLALHAQSEELVRLLLDNGADEEKKNSTSRTALDLAKERGYTSMVAMLDAA